MLDKIYDKTEKKFAKICLDKGFKLKHSNKEEDINEHWDWKVNDSLVDVKGARKKTRSDKLPNYNITWLEITNVRGNIGWLKGKADFIAFEQKDYFLIVKREDLFNWLKSKITNKQIVTNPEKAMYRLYRRRGKKDLVSMVQIKDIKNDLKCWKFV